MQEKTRSRLGRERVLLARVSWNLVSPVILFPTVRTAERVAPVPTSFDSGTGVLALSLQVEKFYSVFFQLVLNVPGLARERQLFLFQRRHRWVVRIVVVCPESEEAFS